MHGQRHTGATHMTELSGTLVGVGLPALVRFLGGLKKTGSLHLSQDEWRGEIVFHEGQVTHAILETRTGLSALDGMIELLPAASFGFDAEVKAAGEPTLRLNQDELPAHLDEVV